MILIGMHAMDNFEMINFHESFVICHILTLAVFMEITFYKWLLKI